jgi:hypothetical protein
MRRAAEDRARAVLHQDEVRDIDRQRPGRVEGMRDAQARVEAELLGLVDVLLRRAGALALLDEGLERGVRLRRGLGERVIGGDAEELRAEQRVRARRVDLDLVRRRRHSIRARNEPAALPSGRSSSSASAAPCRASGSDPPARRAAPDRRSVILKNHCVSSRCSTGAPERQPRPSMTCSLASTVSSTGIPVDLGRLAVDEPGLEEVEEHLLLVAIIGRVAGRELAAPVERQAHGLELRAHGGDVGVGPFARVHLVGLAAFSAGRPKASHPIGCSTAKPLARL